LFSSSYNCSKIYVVIFTTIYVIIAICFYWEVFTITTRKRLQVTLSNENYAKIEETANRYGITINSFMAFILGQWVDNNYAMEKEMAKKVDKMFEDPFELLSNPALLEMVKEILKNDEEFKVAASHKLNEQN